jgi:hypothetical protein
MGRRVVVPGFGITLFEYPIYVCAYNDYIDVTEVHYVN